MKARIQQLTSPELPRTPCSPSSIPETDAAWDAYQADPTSDKSDPWGLAAKLERERNAAKSYKRVMRVENERLRGAIRKIGRMSHTTDQTALWNAIEDAQRILPENS